MMTNDWSDKIEKKICIITEWTRISYLTKCTEIVQSRLEPEC